MEGIEILETIVTTISTTPTKTLIYTIGEVCAVCAVVGAFILLLTILYAYTKDIIPIIAWWKDTEHRVWSAILSIGCTVAIFLEIVSGVCAFIYSKDPSQKTYKTEMTYTVIKVDVDNVDKNEFFEKYRIIKKASEQDNVYIVCERDSCETPKYDIGDIVKYETIIDSQTVQVTGTITDVHKYGDFTQNEVPSYDIKWITQEQSVIALDIREDNIIEKVEREKID